MIQRISPPLLTVQGRGNQRANIRGAAKKGRNCIEEEEGISKKQKGEQEP